MEINRRSFLGGLLGLAATPIIKPKRSLFFFGQSYKISYDDARFIPVIYGDGHRYIRGIVPLEHAINGKLYSGIWAVSVSEDTLTDHIAKKRVIENINWFREEAIKGAISYTESPVINKFRSV